MGKILNITIIGAGNAGLSHAAMIAKQGHLVTIVKTTHQMSGLSDDVHCHFENCGQIR